MAKDYLDNIDTKRVIDTISEATQDPGEKKAGVFYTEAEKLAFKNEFRTSGRRCVKLPRINMAFTQENYDYINIMSRVRGETLTQFVNFIISKNRELNADLFDRAIELINDIQS
jgi:hypothetical protein